MTMSVRHDVCYPAVERDDPRFDGQFYTAVLTTGIFCRSICKSRTPRAENVRFFSTAAAAAEAGFRPCLRCRPESAPDAPDWHFVSPTVSRALRLIGTGLLDRHTTDELARRLNVSSRHLQRLFLEELGTPPVAVAQTRRLLFAKKLIDETSLPMSEVAFSAGYRSVRRFNEAIQQTYGRTPSEIRSKRRRQLNGPTDTSIDLRLYYREPYNWPAMLAFLSDHAIPSVEQVRGNVWRRTVRYGDRTGVIEVEPIQAINAVTLRVPAGLSRELLDISERVKHLFDLRADPAAIDERLSLDPAVGALAGQYPGTRSPGTWDIVESTVRAVLDVALGHEGASLAMGLIVQTFGEEIPGATAESVTHLFPETDRLLDAPLDEFNLPANVVMSIQRSVRKVSGQSPAISGASVPIHPATGFANITGIDEWGPDDPDDRRSLRTPLLDEADPGGSGASGPTDHGSINAPALDQGPWARYAAIYRWWHTRSKNGDLA